MGEPWWKSAVVYQIYPRSFRDTDGDGVGDLEGIRRGLDHLAWLGVDAIWLSPIFPSPMADFGYDVADYCDVDPLFGDLAAFDRLVEEAHERGIRVILDWVPNHTSDRHPWFVESRSSPSSPRRDWYIWRDPAPDGGPPNNWIAAFTGESAWTLDETTGQYYLHLFLPEQPDLNWRNSEVVEAMHRTLRFWLDRGVDGFRIDVVHGLVKHPDLPDVDGDQNFTTDRYDEPAIHELLRGFRNLLDSYPGERMMVGEVYILSTAAVARFYGKGDELHLAFNFPPLYAPWDADRWRRRVDRVVEEIHATGGWPTWVLSNHDNPRHRTRYGQGPSGPLSGEQGPSGPLSGEQGPSGPLSGEQSEQRARAAAVLLLTLRGTPFMYAGEELGLEDAVIPPDRVVDPGGRDGCRAPIPWDGSPAHGWADPLPWLPWPPGAEERNAEALQADPDSILHLYRRMLAARQESVALRLGDWSPVATPDGVLGYLRAGDGDRRAVFVNFTATPQRIMLDGTWSVEVASNGAGEGEPFDGSLPGDAAVVLRPGA
jgi:alpha-glucosidase